MTAIQPIRIAEGRAMLLAGLRRHHTYAGAAEGIPAQWRELVALGTLPGQVGSTRYGVLCGASPEERTMEYMCAVEVDGFGALPPEMGRMRVPPQHYAVFEHRGHVSTLAAAWQAAWDALPGLGYAPLHGPEFERYGEAYDPATGMGGMEIWAAIHPPR